MNQQTSQEFDNEQEKVLDSIRPGKIIFPTLIGLAVVVFLVRRQLNLDELFEINWNSWSYLWILIAILVYCGRHLLYSLRLRLLSEKDFSWAKSIELTAILEFASCVSPTNFGGSAVAFFLLIQENIAAARATAIVIYTIIADTLFFVLTLPVLWLLFGSEIFVPPLESISEWDSLGITLIIAWAIMTIYGVLLLYGLFVEPKHLKKLLRWIASWKILKRSKDRILGAADDIEVSSLRIRAMPKNFHLNIAGITLFAWILRFFTVSAILIALNTNIALSLYDHLILLGRGEGLYAVTAYSPTPGGSGVAEIIFGQFYKEYVTPGIAVIAAIIWRVITYYPYLILGVIIIPNWIRKLINKRRVNKEN